MTTEEWHKFILEELDRINFNYQCEYEYETFRQYILELHQAECMKKFLKVGEYEEKK